MQKDSASEAPPPYQAEAAPADSIASGTTQAAAVASTQQTEKTVEIYVKPREGLDIKLGDRNLYHINIHGSARNHGLTIYGGYDGHGPQLATAKFHIPDEDFDLFVGGQYSENRNNWGRVRCATDGKLFSSSYYRFGTNSSASTGSRSKKFYWQKTHDSKLGSSLLSVRDFKLVSEDSEEVVAVYNEQSSSWTKRYTTLKGKVKFTEVLGEEAEAAAILVLLTILFKSNEDWKDRSRVLVRSN